MLVAAVRTGITARLAAGHATAAEIAADLGLDPLPTRLLLDCLRSAGHVTERSGRYRLSRGARRWLDPASPLSVGRLRGGRRRLLGLVGRAGRDRPDWQVEPAPMTRRRTTRTGAAT